MKALFQAYLWIGWKRWNLEGKKKLRVTDTLYSLSRQLKTSPEAEQHPNCNSSSLPINVLNSLWTTQGAQVSRTDNCWWPTVCNLKNPMMTADSFLMTQLFRQNEPHKWCLILSSKDRHSENSQGSEVKEEGVESWLVTIKISPIKKQVS